MIKFHTSFVVSIIGSFILSAAFSAYAQGEQGAPSDASMPPPVIIQSAPPQPILEIAKPVETATLGDVDPESVGLLAASDGGLGASLWKGTSRSVAEQLFSSLRLPTSSFALNALARRLLISTTAVPEGGSSISQSLPSLRVMKLISLGDADDAWKLQKLIKPDYLSEVAMREALEAMLVSPGQSVDVCSMMPDIIKAHNGPDWQKIMVVCQLRAKDFKAAQLGLDLLQAQDVKDDTFFALAEKNIIGENKQLPKQLTPLNPVTLALLQLSGLDAPSEVFSHPEAILIPALLHLSTKDEGARLALAEYAGEKGLITASDLEAAYSSISPVPVNAIKGSSVTDSDLYNRALLYQAAMQDNTMQGRINNMIKYVQISPPALLNGVGGTVAADMVSIVPAAPDFYVAAPWMVRVNLLAGKISNAVEWLKLAHEGSDTTATVAGDIQYLWPILVFSGVVADHDYAADRSHWLDMMLKSKDAQTDHAMRERAASILLLFDAAGLPVSDSDWARVMDAANDASTPDARGPSALVISRLRAASAAGKRGETAMLSLLAADSTPTIPFYAVLETVRALRTVGLVGDATGLAREAASRVLFEPVTH